MNKTYVLKVRFCKKEKAEFMRAFKKSHYRTMADYVRFLISVDYVRVCGSGKK